jgi:hypothetical protein
MTISCCEINGWGHVIELITNSSSVTDEHIVYPYRSFNGVQEVFSSSIHHTHMSSVFPAVIWKYDR